MVDVIIKFIGFLAEKYAAASKYIVAGFLSVILIAGVVIYFFGGQLIESQVDYYLMKKINAYFEGEDGALATAAKRIDPKITNVAATQLQGIRNSLYEEVDAVYQVSNTFTKSEVAKLGSATSLTFPLYIYADLTKHRVVIFLNRRNNSFSILLCFNNDRKSCKERTSNVAKEDITETLKLFPLKASNAGVESESLTYPENIQLIQITPQRLNWAGGDVASVEGYVMVKRAAQGPVK